MKIKPEKWKIKDLVRKKEKINPKPQYQRTPVWTEIKKQLLIDSILRGYDLPKFYIRNTPHDKLYETEVIDGQQRMRAIWEFCNNDFSLGELCISGKDLSNKKYEQLPSNYRDKFDGFNLSFSVVESATQEEIRSLFARLQMGVTLNPAELRHAIASNIGNIIHMTVENHRFFNEDCKILNGRYKHQDYLDHVATLIFYKLKYDLKAPYLKKLYEDYGSAKADSLSNKFAIINKILDWMYEINSYSKGIFKNKWGFVDIFYFLYENYNLITSIKAADFAQNLLVFEKNRREYNSLPERLIEDKTKKSYDKDLYDYIIAFKVQGGIINNIKIRARVYDKYFNNSKNLEFRS